VTERGFTESEVEEAALAWLEDSGWKIRSGAEIAPGEPAAERDDYGQVVLVQRLRDALARLNPQLPAEALEDAFRKLTRPEGADLIHQNRVLHRLLVDGVTVEYRDAGGNIRGAQARVIDFDDTVENDWLAVNQFSVVENKHARRLDVVLFVNGLPLAVLELKNAAAESATIWSAFQQLQTYQAEVPALLVPNALLAISDGGRGARRRAWRRARVVQALADYHGRDLGRTAPAGAAGGGRGAVRAAAFPRPAARLHRVRGRRQRPHRQEDGRLPSVPCRAGGGR
jgi:type I restriction enzyme, R subunit